MRFAGKVAFITGAGRGIGEVFAEALTADGASVVIGEIDMEAANEVAAALTRAGRHALAVPCDVADPASVAAAVKAATERFGGIDILINNAGMHSLEYGQPVTKLPIEKWRHMLNVNVIGIVNCSAACRPAMSGRGGGVIVNMSSIAGITVNTAYGVSKLAVRGLTTALAEEFAPDGIRVYALAPGLMDSAKIVKDLPQDMKDRLIGQQFIKRAGKMADLVGALKFFCSEDASFITGEMLIIGGGLPQRI